MRSRRNGLLAFVSLTLLFFSAPPAAFSETVPQKKPWTMLVYMNAFNNLDPFGNLDLNEMERVGSTEKVNVVVQWASFRQKDVRRLLVRKDDDDVKISSPVLQNLGKIDMGDYRSLVDFVRWGKENFPAEKYFVVVWNHGNGWHRFGLKDSVTRVDDISYDDYSGNFITTEQLGTALGEVKTILGQKIDLYGSDACLMSMAEVAGEMKDFVNVSVGSQNLEPLEGWPYTELLQAWNAKENASERDVAEILVKSYVNSYPGQISITLSAFDLRNYDRLADSVRALKDAIHLASASVKAKYVEAAKSAASFSELDYRDLAGFVDSLKGRTLSTEVRRTVLSDVKTAVGDFVIANAASPDQSGAHGVSIWLPIIPETFDQYADRYSRLGFNRDTGWIDGAKTISTK